MGVTAIKPGILTTVQDRGRTGYLGSGFSPSGVMDTRALHTANLLVDNDPDAPVLEFCLAGPTLRFTTSTYVAITGGDFRPTLDGRPIIMLSDRQTTGGYAKIGTVCSVDLPKLVQCTPGRIIRFAPVTIQQAQDLYRQEARRMEALAKMVRRPCYGGISPRRTARRLTPILEAQARAHASGSQKLWIELSKTEQQRLQPAEQPASDPNR